MKFAPTAPTEVSVVSDHRMWNDPEYLQAWRGLRRCEVLFWFFVLSYVPGRLLVIVAANVFDQDVPEHTGAFFSGAWLAGFVGSGLYLQSFRCPRGHYLFFRRSAFVDPHAQNCLNCNLACWAYTT
jgi:hypothetical protein